MKINSIIIKTQNQRLTQELSHFWRILKFQMPDHFLHTRMSDVCHVYFSKSKWSILRLFKRFLNRIGFS